VQSEHERAIDLARQALATRERTVAELRGFLESKRVEPASIEAAVSELTDTGVLDDADYAVRFTEDRRSLRRWGRERIERDLRRRGVEPEIVEAAVGGHGHEDELRAALELLGERAPDSLDSERDRDRAWRMLVRRGYEPELAYDAIRLHSRRSDSGAQRAA
jgi:regulatory protein